MDGQDTLFRPETIIVSFLHLMVFICKILIDLYDDISLSQIEISML